MNPTDINYTSASIFFPREWGESRLYYEPPSFVVTRLRFMYKDLGIEAVLQPFHLPAGLTNSPEIDKPIIQPGIELVLADVKPAEGLLNELKTLAAQMVVEEQMAYERSPQGNSFRVYDWSRGRTDKPMSTLLLFKGQRSSFLQEGYRDLPAIARDVYQERNKVPHVVGETLQEALQRAIVIYKMNDRLKQIQ